MKPMSNYEHHRLDQCEAGIERGLAAFAAMSNEEFAAAMNLMEKDAHKFGDDWIHVKRLAESTRRKP